jgi:hypothetical protein
VQTPWAELVGASQRRRRKQGKFILERVSVDGEAHDKRVTM